MVLKMLSMCKLFCDDNSCGLAREALNRAITQLSKDRPKPKTEALRECISYCGQDGHQMDCPGRLDCAEKAGAELDLIEGKKQ